MPIKLLAQKQTSKEALYRFHEPSVYCVAKGKASKTYELGIKVSLVFTHKEGLLLSGQSLATPAYDGHTLLESHCKAEQLTGKTIAQVFVAKGYRGTV